MLFVIPSFPCRSETFIKRELNALKNQNVDITIFTLRGEQANSKAFNLLLRKRISVMQCLAAFISNIAVFPSGVFLILKYIMSYFIKPLYMLKLLRNSIYAQYIARYIREYQIQIIHAHFADMATDIARLLQILTKVPYSFSIHANDFFVCPLQLRKKIQNASAVFCCSSFLAKKVRQFYFATYIHTAYHGLSLFDDFSFSNFDNVSKERLAAPRSEFKLLAVGRLVPKKGFHILIHACYILRKRNFEFSCKIIGDGREYSILSELIKYLDLRQTITLRGSQSLADVTSEYRNAHALIVPSVIATDGDQDNIPNVILEAQALGLPVIASNLDSLKEVVINNKTGFSSQAGCSNSLANTIQLVSERYDSLTPILGTARKQVEEKFDIDKNVKTIISKWCDFR